MSTQPAWHNLSAEDAAQHLGVAPGDGLSEAEATARLTQHGPNRLTPRPGRSGLMRFLAQFSAPLVLVLIAAGLVTALLGEWVDAGVIFGVVVINAIVGHLQEGKAEAALAALARTLAAEATVLRNGIQRRIDATELVPGDIVVLAAGDRIPADVRLLRGRELRTAEAALTGESLPVEKDCGALPADTLLADRRNMAYAGTALVSGQGQGLVVATGDATETGRISGLMAATLDLETPLTRQLARFSALLLWIILALAVLTFGVGLVRGEPAVEMFMAAVALAVGAIPEGLPAAVTATLAIGVGRMARHRAIIRKLPAVETLGSTTVICSDKTGTLTENAMTVTAIFAGGRHYRVDGQGYAPVGALYLDDRPIAAEGPLQALLLAGALCNDAGLNQTGDTWTIVGDPTEAALLVLAQKAGLDTPPLARRFPRSDALPFDSARQTMATFHAVETGMVGYWKGALEKLLPQCTHWLDDPSQPSPLGPEIRRQIEDVAHAMARRGLRVLALARQTDGGAPSPGEAPGHLCFLGLVGMIDPPRPTALAAVRTCQRAGIRVKMITGDHAETALAIARQLGIAGEKAHALTGRDLAALDDSALIAAAADTDVFARVAPEQKLRLVRALQARGAVVAMTGDGVNDAPALKQADIGIAMGQAGTDVAKEAAAMVLTDDNFATIERAVEEGRGIYDNLVKFITWTLPTNFGEGLVILAAIVGGITLPITPLQILWINMTTAVLLGLTLAFEPVEGDVMSRPPRRPGAPMLDTALMGRIILVSLLLLAGAFGLFMRHLDQGATLAEARTIAVNVFVMVELTYLFNCRSLTRSAHSIGWLSNPWIWVGCGLMLGLQGLLTYLPIMNRLFQTAPIGFQAWLEIIAVALVASGVVGLEKRLKSGIRSAPV